jgi:hypothetical protein
VDRPRLVYLYVGSADVGRDLAFYVDQLGGELAWRVASGGTEVAAVRLGQGPLVLLADHRPAPTVLQIWAVQDLGRTADAVRAAGWRGPEHMVEVPDGPCLILSDPSGNKVGLLEQRRPGVMERHMGDQSPP